MSDKIKFNPIRCSQETLNSYPKQNGNVYFITDAKSIYLDVSNDKRILMSSGGGGGSSSSGIFYGRRVLQEGEADTSILDFSLDKIDGDVLPGIDDLIFNIPDSSFYRVTQVQEDDNKVLGTRLAVAGGGGASSLAEPIDLNVETLATSNLINGKSQVVYYTATSAKNNAGKIIDSTLTISWNLAYTEDGGVTYTTYATGQIDNVPTGVRQSFDFGSQAKQSATSRLTFVASQMNSTSTVTRAFTFNTSSLTLKKSSSFNNLAPFEITNIVISCTQTGNMDKYLDYYWDGELISTVELTASSVADQSIKIHEVLNAAGKTIAHGYHTVKIVLSQRINGAHGLSVEPLEFEIATKVANNDKPIIWLGSYQNQYYNYDTIQIPYRVYDPKAVDRAEVHLYKDSIEIDSSPRIITDTSAFSIFEITDGDMNVKNYYQIACGTNELEVRRDINFTIVQDPSRLDFGIQKQAYLTLEFDARGRSNSESATKRKSWSYTSGNDDNTKTITGIFDNFNWYNNGWMTDSNGNTFLRISNGASFTIPLGKTTFANSSNATEQSNSFEFQFRIRNVQDYSTLIRNVTRYKDDAAYYAAFYDEETNTYKTDYTNYDSFLKDYFYTHHIAYTDPTTGEIRDFEYDDLEFNYVSKQINLNNIACGYYSGDSTSVVGLALGPQDAFFSNGTNTVNVSYVEDEIISVSVVYSYTSNLMYIYINGVLTGVIKKSEEGSFTVDNENLVFNSNSCDIDLLKVRVYHTDLNVNDIVTNYAVDLRDVTTYDQNKLAIENTAINEYQFNYQNMIDYNNNHPNSPLMPYVIFDTSKCNNGDRLSYAKSVNLDIGFEFVNTPLELAYTSGELEELAKEDGLWDANSAPEEKVAAVKTYYQHHCPSFISDHANMAVQGTSSEFYPRRNYKIKTKTSYHKIEDADATAEAEANNATANKHKLITPVYEEQIGILLNRGPFAADYAADVAGYTAAKYIKSADAYDANTKYYTDSKGENKATVTEATYVANTYYIKNPAHVDIGDESSRQKYWYMNNYTTGTTKFTMKIDYMESSGSYNMGFANLVKNAYSKHPLDDYSRAGAFIVDDPTNTSYDVITTWDENTTYYYRNHKGNWKNTKDDELNILASEADFLKGPATFAAEKTITKVLNESNVETAASNANMTVEEMREYINKWYTTVPAYKTYTIDNTDEYRTSVQGFRVLAFHKKSDGSYQYIGMYNMLIDKGSDECYGFKPDKTTGKTIYQKFKKNKKVPKIAECWEFSNNSRTFCSFRDPLNRKDLSFDVYTMNGNTKVPTLNSKQSAPVVTDSFEYRYHKDADILDYIYDPDKNGDKYKSEDCVAYMDGEDGKELLFNSEDTSENYDNRAEVVFDAYANWEKAVAWVWSTNTDSVGAQGEYNEINVGNTAWAPNTFYIYQEAVGDTPAQYVLDTGVACDNSITYYTRKPFYSEVDVEVGVTNVDNYYIASGSSYIQASGVAAEGIAYYKIDYTYANAHVSTNIYEKGKYYTIVNDSYVLSNDKTFDESATYYKLEEYTDAQMEQGITKGGITTKYDRLVKQCAKDAVYDADTIYYKYDGTAAPGSAVTKVTDLTAEIFAEHPTEYYVGYEQTYGTNKYRFDTKEYRAAKFVAELENHFDMEYLATYFVMTEVFECYDSRGKNCMMASWGPKASGGDYIWYPIFYDIDTQLGINNTGIPSFEYNVDATEDGNYSTSDSVLWNNFYKYFKSSYILMKYKHLKGITEGVEWSNLNNPPLRDVDNIEGWYLTDPDVCKSIVMRGERPLIATNLDEYYKYITITNNKSYQNGVTGHISSDSKGTWTYDQNGTYFYALQGDRSLSRQQFLANRLDYLDSWLNQGNYARGGMNRIAGRIAANNSSKTSDIWIETDDNPYYQDAAETIKSHEFDAEYWVNLTPTHSSYVTLGDDNEAYPSVKYDGINPVKFKINSIENGVRKSNNYPEQLLYIYGLSNMADLGDMSNLYWQEFRIEGDATHLTKLKLGYDGLMTYKDAEGHYQTYCDEQGTVDIGRDDGKKAYRWHNDKMNLPSIPSEESMPLLKEVNLCNMQINTGTPTLNLTSCEKLENFRATGSNFVGLTFAPGVALNTLYLPRTLTTLKLTEARLLTKLITNYSYPEKDDTTGDLIAEPGLYLEGMFEGEGTTSLTKIDLAGGGLGSDSYALLKKYYDITSARTVTTSRYAISMTDVNWSPYTQLVEGDTYVAADASKYFVDNFHYGFTPYVYDLTTWDTLIANGELYKLTGSIETANDDPWTLLKALVSDAHYTGLTTGSNPNITGVMYINNATTLNEYDIRQYQQANYPGLKLFFANVEQEYTARFIIMNSDGETYSYVKSNPESIQTIKNGWFTDPIDAYGHLAQLKKNYDFYGWAATPDPSDSEILINDDKTINDWTSQALTSDKTYTFYAIFKIHQYTMTFMSDTESRTKKITFNEPISAIDTLIWTPAKDDSILDNDKTYALQGWAFNENATVDDVLTLSDYRATKDYTFYPVFKEVSVYDNVLDDKYLQFNYRSATSNTDLVYGPTEQGLRVSVAKGCSVSGKITLPASHVITAEDTDVLSGGKGKVKVGDELKIVAINADGFNGQTALTHVFLEKGSSLQSIGNQAFSGCSQLTYFEMIPSVKWVGASGFASSLFGNNSKDSVNLLGSVEHIGAGAFAASNANESIKITQIVVPGTVQYIGSGAFGYWDTSIIQLGTKENSIYIPSFIGGEETHNNVKYYWASDCFVNLIGPEDSAQTICVNAYSSLSSSTEVQNRIGSCFRRYDKTTPGVGFSYSALDI